MHLRHSDIRIQAERAWLDALLSFAPDVRGLIICASPYISHLRESRLNYAAGILREGHFGTLIVSMLTPYEESRDPDVRYDISLIGNRLQALLTWIDQQPGLSGLPLGMLASQTVVGAAIRLLSREPARISALVSTSGRADLAGAEPLRKLRVPVLMQVPGAEPELIPPSTQAYAHLGGIKQWHEVSHASARFIEPGVLEAVSREARDWFIEYMPDRTPPADAEAAPPA